MGRVVYWCILLAVVGCEGKEHGVQLLSSSFDVASGRGMVTTDLGNGSRLQWCFSCAYGGYAGGLQLGDWDRAAVRLERGDGTSARLFCAQDETIRLGQVDYDFGWSLNSRQEERRLLVLDEAAVLRDLPETVVLFSRNRAGCLVVDKLASFQIAPARLTIATKVRNRCSHNIDFDFITGDDPFLGSESCESPDTGWSDAGFIEHETALAGNSFRWGGLLDSKCQVATAVVPSPEFQPDHLLFTNRFVQSPDDINPSESLGASQLTVVNLLWQDVSLLPGGEWIAEYTLLPLDRTPEPGEGPPDALRADWGLFERFGAEVPPISDSATGVQFVEEEVTMEVEPGWMRLTGTYLFANRSQTAQVATIIAFPILQNEAQLAPRDIAVDGADFSVTDDGIRFPLSLGPQEQKPITIRYIQDLTTRNALYITTTANNWPEPPQKALFRIRYPRCLGGVQLSYPTQEFLVHDDYVEQVVVFTDFRPSQELRMEWSTDEGCASNPTP